MTPSRRPGPLRVLYVDDDAGIARLVQKHLERAGYAVVWTADGASGIAAAASGGFDVIALDHYMPGRDGLEVLGALNAMPDAPPVIFVTAAEEPRIAVSALRQGAADYVLKDVHGVFLESLSSAIRRALDQQRFRREKAEAEQELLASRDRLEKLAAQQAIMLREVDHRVANSLQLITALIGLQATKLRDPAARHILRTAVDRVEAVSLVHRRLYTSEDLQFVRMDQYLSGLIGELRRVAAGTAERDIALHAAPVRLETDKAVPLGLIVNELVTNSLKYAYPAGEAGMVRVSMTQDDVQAVTLVVEDDGIGTPEPSGSHGSGLGAVIVRSMAEKLHASVSLDRSHKGTRTTVKLPG